MTLIDTKVAAQQGNYFEDFKIGQVFKHGVPRTITEADATLHLALTGSRFPLHCASPVAQACGFKSVPLDNLLVFHIAFGKTVNDISLNAIANLGYAEVKFEQPCFADDSLFVCSEVIGLKQNSNGKNGVIYVRSTATNQNNKVVVSWIRWVMVEKHDVDLPAPKTLIPDFKTHIPSDDVSIPQQTYFDAWKNHWSDNQIKFDALNIGDAIFHQSGITINDSGHSLATNLYQNNAKVHFDQHQMQHSSHGQRLVYGGHIISICRALSYNGVGNALWVSGINAGSHTNPCFSGDTIYCQSEVIDKKEINQRSDIGLIRIRMLGIKNDTPNALDFIDREESGRLTYHQNIVLDLDYWALMLK